MGNRNRRHRRRQEREQTKQGEGEPRTRLQPPTPGNPSFDRFNIRYRGGDELYRIGPLVIVTWHVPRPMPRGWSSWWVTEQGMG